MHIKICLLWLLSLIGISASCQVAEKLAGIEVGSKGVKLSIIEKSNNQYRLLKDTSINSDFISFSSQSYDATLNALISLYDYTKKEWKLQPDKIATVISSGVKAQADKLNKHNHLNTFIEAFRIKSGEESKEVEVVSVKKESVLSHYGIITDAERYNVFLIDIGSGNTKGGYFTKGTDEFVMFQIPSGTKSTTNVVEKACATPCDFLKFKDALPAILDSVEQKEIIYSVNTSGAYPSSTTMAVSGGIAWAVATLLYPEKTDEQQIEVGFKDIVRFRDALIKYHTDIPDTNKLVIKGIKPEALTKIRKEVQRVLNVFDTKALLSGSGLLLKIMRQFEAANSTKKFRLIKNGQVGWITGYISTTMK